MPRPHRRILPWNDACIIVFALFLVGAPQFLQATSPVRPDSAPRQIPGLISSAQLNPPLQSRIVELRFSADGHFVLLQDESAAYVLTLNPPRIQLTVPARDVLPARLTKDSERILLATPDMSVATWSIADGKLLSSRVLGGGYQCTAATLSRYGDYYACIDGYSTLHVFDTSSGTEILKKLLGQPVDQRFGFITPFHQPSAFSQPFGYALSRTPSVYPGFAPSALKVVFSPDAHYLIALDRFGHAEAFDLINRTSLRLSGDLRHVLEHDSFAFAGPDQIAAASDDGRNSELLSFPQGSATGKLGLTGEVRATDNPELLIAIPNGSNSAELFNVKTGKAVVQFPNDAANVWSDQLIYATGDGLLVLARVGDAHPELELRTPVPAPWPLRAAAVSPDLGTVAIGIEGQGGVFDAESGKRREVFNSLRGAWCQSDKLCYLQTRSPKNVDSNVLRLDLTTSADTIAWSFENQFIRNENIFSGPVMLKHYLTRIMIFPDSSRFPYELHALDVATGKLLWIDAFGPTIPGYTGAEDIPLVFTDPQGGRVVLGCAAKTQRASRAADRSPALKRAMDRAKLSAHDSVFEVIDGRSGKFIGAALVQTGAGPESFNEAFSEGDWLILARDGRDVICFSLSTGAEIEEHDVYNPAVSGATSLLSAIANDGRLFVYDLKRNSLWAQYTFPSAVAYSHFSADGKRLLVLTAQQMVYVIDVEKQSETSN